MNVQEYFIFNFTITISVESSYLYLYVYANNGNIMCVCVWENNEKVRATQIARFQWGDVTDRYT